MTAAEVTSIAINKHSQVQGTAEVSYRNSFFISEAFAQCVCKYSTVFTSIIILELCNCTN